MALAIATTASGMPSPPPAAAATDLLPNLKVLPASDLVVQEVGGRRLLRFTTIVVNEGPGAFEVRGWRASTDELMTVRQLIFDSSGGWRRKTTGAIVKWAGDGHDHWHVQDVTSYELWPVGDTKTVRRGVKIGLCFFDTTPWRLSLPRAKQSPYYRESACATHGAVRTMRAGISVGWGDNYPWHFAFQWIDVTGLSSGQYVLRTTVDQANWYAETRNFDNCLWVRIAIPEPGAGTKVRVIERGSGCSESSSTPVTVFPGAAKYDPPIRLIVASGTHTAITVNSLGTTLRTKKTTRPDGEVVRAAVRARIPGRDGRWFYVTTGPWAGYWLRDNSRVNPVP